MHNCLARAEGFEPPNAGTKTRCLTTWPRPTSVLIIQKCCRLIQTSHLYRTPKICLNITQEYGKKNCSQRSGFYCAAYY